MVMRTITDAGFGKAVLASPIPVLVDFCAEWCRPSRAMAPALEKIAAEFEGRVKVVRLDVEKNPSTKLDYEVHGLPTLILFKNGRPVARRIGALVCKDSLEEWINAALALALATQSTSAVPRASEFSLMNGMTVIVIPDRRVPLVTHMVWYKVGKADEQEGEHGVSAFLSHLTFRSKDRNQLDEFTKTIARLGGQNDAFASRDATAYYERIAKDQLPTVMQMEASRMSGLHLTDDSVESVSQIFVEMRSRADASPGLRLEEQMYGALYGDKPLSSKINCARERAKLSRANAERFFNRHYAPNNAVLVVLGDVSSDEVLQLAQDTYGKIPGRPRFEERRRLLQPPDNPVRIIVTDHCANVSTFRRVYAVPSYATAQPGEAEALDLLTKILAIGMRCRLQRKLVIDEKLAISVGGSYAGISVDRGTISLSAVADCRDLGAIEAGVDMVLDDIRQNGVTQTELQRAKKSWLANYIYDCDNQDRLALRYGWAGAIGRTIDKIEGWPAQISKVTVGDIKKVANEYLDVSHSVTGWLLPEHVAKGRKVAT